MLLELLTGEDPGRHKRVGTKISAVVDKLGFPLSVILAPGNIHDLPLAVPTVDKIQVGKKKKTKHAPCRQGI
ncbi:MAG: transposase [Patescibacteria group bacterium]